MLKALTALKDTLYSDQELVAMIATYKGGPAFAFGVAPDDMPMPYLVATAPSNVIEDARVLDRMLYTINVYVDHGDIVTADAISKKIRGLLDEMRLPVDAGIGVWLEFETVIPEEDPGIIHYVLQFMLRHL